MQFFLLARAIPSWKRQFPTSRKITEVKQLGPWSLVSTWMSDHSSVEVDAVVKNTVKSHEWRNGPPI